MDRQKAINLMSGREKGAVSKINVIAPELSTKVGSRMCFPSSFRFALGSAQTRHKPAIPP
jgi:hypothetical protein